MLTWAEVTGMLAIVGAIAALIGWMLPSPIQMQNRLATIEKDLAVLVNTVSTLRGTVDDLVKWIRGPENGSTTGRRSRL